MKIAAIALLTILSSICHGQTDFVKGFVVDAETGAALPFANIIVSQRPTGTTSDKNGEFIIKSDNFVKNDTLIISYIGYQSKKVCVKSVNENTIPLSPQMLFLDEFTVSALSKRKKITLNKFSKRSCFILRTNKHSGSDEYWLPYRAEEPTIEALYICNKDNIVSGNKIKKAVIYVNNLKDSCSFRLRIFNASEKKRPATDLLTESLVIAVTEKEELVEVDLERFNLVIPENGIFVGFELLIIPENRFILELPDGSGTYTQYSPFLQYYEVNQPKYDSWIYTKGKWTKHAPTLELSKNKTKNLTPAISLILE
jgi:hypothetical protein